MPVSNESDDIMALKAIDELKFKIGSRFLADVLTGNKTERVKKYSFHKNKYFGCLGAFTEQDAHALLNELEFKGFIEIKKPDPNKFYKVICLTDKGKREINEKKNLREGIQSNIEPVTDADRIIFSSLGSFLGGLNDFQKKAVIDCSKHILCIAGAGTGKTTALTKRIEFLSMLKNVPDEKILAITFTRKARREMVKRLNKAIPGNNFHIETFNSFCEKMLLKSGHLIYDKEHKVLDFKNKISLINSILKEEGHTPESAIELYYSHRKYISEDKRTLYLRFINDLFAVMDHCRNMEKDFNELKEAVKGTGYADRDVAVFVLKVLEKIISYKKTLGYRDYTDQIVHAIELFSKYPESIPEFEHILVDEYQDVNNMQIKLIELLKPKNIFAVGDPRQSIFGWRGSNIQHITRFKEKYPESKILELKVNYRSKKHIIKTLNSLISPMKLPEISCCEENALEDKNVMLLEHDNEDAEHLFVAQSILNSRVPRNDIFVLARTNRQIEKIAEALGKFKIGFIKRTVEEQQPNIEPEQGQITLSTVHAIKGLEADSVYLIGANSFSFPCRASEHPILDILKANDDYDSYDEELRVLYVALSRAKSKLVINYYSSLTPFINERTISMIESNDKKSHDETKIISKEKFSGNKLFEALRKWRLEKSKELKVLPFQIFSDKTLIEICQAKPASIGEIYNIYGIGPSKASRFGEEIMKIVFEEGR